MSENTNQMGINVPADQDFDTLGFQGSMQQILQENTGNYVIVEFLIGSNQLVTKQGILYNVASQFLVLYDDIEARYVVCDIFSVKFVTFLEPTRSSTATIAPEEAPALETSARMTPAQAAYAHATRRPINVPRR